MRLIFAILVWSLRAAFRSRSDLVLENLALRQQLATFGRAKTRPVLKPATVIAWHRRGYQRSWRWRSRKPGRPRIDAEHIAFIQRISSDHRLALATDRRPEPWPWDFASEFPQ